MSGLITNVVVKLNGVREGRRSYSCRMPAVGSMWGT